MSPALYDEFDAGGLAAEADDDQADVDDDGPAEVGLWDGDQGTLDARMRDALVLLLKNEYISPGVSASYDAAWRAITHNPDRIRSALNNVYLDLVIDEINEVAYKKQVDTNEVATRTLLHDNPYNREETLLLVLVRERYRADTAAGEDRVYVDATDMYAYVERYRPSHATDVAGDRRKVDNAIASLKRSKLIRDAGGDRFEVHRAIQTLLTTEKLQALADALRTANAAVRARPDGREGVPTSGAISEEVA